MTWRLTPDEAGRYTIAVNDYDRLRAIEDAARAVEAGSFHVTFANEDDGDDCVEFSRLIAELSKVLR